jgi:prophage antirepressor-like protein
MKEESKLFRTFFYQGHQIRAVEHKGETWWVASDVCKVLEIAHVSLAVNGNDGTGNTGLDDDEKDYIMIHKRGRDTAGYTLHQRTRPVPSHQQKPHA